MARTHARTDARTVAAACTDAGRRWCDGCPAWLPSKHMRQLVAADLRGGSEFADGFQEILETEVGGGNVDAILGFDGRTGTGEYHFVFFHVEAVERSNGTMAFNTVIQRIDAAYRLAPNGMLVRTTTEKSSFLKSSLVQSIDLTELPTYLDPSVVVDGIYAILNRMMDTLPTAPPARRPR